MQGTQSLWRLFCQDNFGVTIKNKSWKINTIIKSWLGPGTKKQNKTKQTNYIDSGTDHSLQWWLGIYSTILEQLGVLGGFSTYLFIFFYYLINFKRRCCSY